MRDTVRAMTNHRPVTRLICPLIADNVESMLSGMNAAVPLGADTVECRLDFLTEPPTRDQLARLLSHSPVDVIATCRPLREGGRFAGDEQTRLEILHNAAAVGAAFVDVELDVPRSDWPDAPVILSHHDFDGVPENLEAILSEMEASDAAVNKIAFTAAGPEDAIRALDLLQRCTKPTLALAMGETGVLSRILAGKFGAFGTFASLAGGVESAPGQPSLEELRGVYRWDSLGHETKLFGVVGCPVAHSMSPAVHNASFSTAGVDAVYVPLHVEAGEENFKRFMDAAMSRPGLGLRGLSVTIPHKHNALAYVGADNCDELARRIGAINTVIVSPEGGLVGCNTDYAGAIEALCNVMGIAREQLTGRAVAVIGAGGVSRALVAALTACGAQVTIYNRTVSRGERLAEEFGCEAAGLGDVAALGAEIVINCTSIGMHPNVDDTPLESIPGCVRVVFDTVYNPLETRLLKLAAQAGCLCVSGLDMFVNQAAEQFKLWTGKPAPKDVMRKTVLNRLEQ